LFALAVAAMVGLGATWLALTRERVRRVAIGAWTAWPKSGTRDVDPMRVRRSPAAASFRSARATGVAFVARTDDDARPLDGRCDVRDQRHNPAARGSGRSHCTTPQGRLIGNAIEAPGLHQPGDRAQRRRQLRTSWWRPAAGRQTGCTTTGSTAIWLVLRLYDPPVGVATRAAREAPMPSVVPVMLVERLCHDPLVALACWRARCSAASCISWRC